MIIRGKHVHFASAICLAIGLSLSSCAPKEGEEVVKECVLPQDQSATLAGRWSKPVIPLAFHQGDFTQAEMLAIATAAQVWNSHYAAAANIPIFDFGSGGTPRVSAQARPTSLCSYSLVNSSTGVFQGSVVIYKSSNWTQYNPNNNQDAIALTSFCSNVATPLKSIYMAVMEVNFQYFFGSGQRKPDLTSIFVHELGHLLGLDHSCKPNGATGFPNCTGVIQEYYDAVMFPTVFFDGSGNGQVKSALTANDQGRSNCLYGTSAL